MRTKHRYARAILDPIAFLRLTLTYLMQAGLMSCSSAARITHAMKTYLGSGQRSWLISVAYVSFSCLGHVFTNYPLPIMDQSNDGAASPGGVLGEGPGGGRVLWTPAPGAGAWRGRWEEPLGQVNTDQTPIGGTPWAGG